MKSRLKVTKTDGSIEEYLHTKVIHTISNTLGDVGQSDILLAENLADVVTYYLYHRGNRSIVTSYEILSIIKAVLSTTGYEKAAIALTEHYFQRKLKRSRINVFSVDVKHLNDAEQIFADEDARLKTHWDKSVIVDDLVTKHGLDRQTARTVASMVEEKIFNMQITQVPASLIKQIVLSDTAVMLRANRQLQPA